MSGSGVLEIILIEAIWEEDGEEFFLGSWYIRPEETHTGRQVPATALPKPTPLIWTISQGLSCTKTKPYRILHYNILF